MVNQQNTINYAETAHPIRSEGGLIGFKNFVEGVFVDAF